MSRSHVIGWTLLSCAALALAALLLSTHLPTLYPERLRLLPLVGLGTGLSLQWQRWWNRVRNSIGDSALVRAQIGGSSPRRDQALRSAAILSALCLLIIAYARPQWGETNREVRQHGVDIVLAVDYSHSMLSEDISPSRLRATVDEIDRLLRQIQGDRVGLVVFAGTAFTQAPLTSDLGALRQYLRELHPDDMPVRGTDVGAALETAHRLLSRERNRSIAPDSHKIILLLTDGEDHEERALQVAEQIRGDGIELIAAAIGTEDGGTIPTWNRRGERLDIMRYTDGSPVITQANLGFVEELATLAGGTALRFTSPGEIANAVLSTIAAREATDFGSASRIERAERHVIFIWPALTLLLLARLRRRRPLKAIGLTTLVLLSGCADDAPWMVQHPTLSRAQSMAETNPEQALALLESLRDKQGVSAIAALERGRVREHLERWQQARADYFEALADEGLTADANVGIGNTWMGEEQWQDAITRYRRALRIDPDHEVARRNLELAHWHRFPPCSVLRDSEDGPAPGELHSIEEGESPSKSEDGWIICGGDGALELTLPALGADRIVLNLKATRLRDDYGGPAPPSSISPQQFRVELLSESGELIGSDPSSSSPEGADNPARINREVTTEPLPGRYTEPHNVRIRITLDEPLEARIHLETEIIPPCRRLKGDFAHITSQASAQTLNAGELTQRLCADDDDWYRYHATEGRYVFIDVSPISDDDGENWEKEAELVNFPEINLRPSPVAHFHSGGLAEPLDESRYTWIRLSAHEEQEGDYQLTIRDFGSCDVDDDHLSPNHQPHERAQLGASSLPMRHLRMCAGRPDWFEITDLPEPDEDGAREPIIVMIEHSDSELTPTLHAFSDTGQMLHINVEELHLDPDQDEHVDPLKPRLIIAEVEPQGEMNSLVLAISGDDVFYHLDLPDVQGGQSDNQDADDSGDGDSEHEDDSESEEGQGGDSDQEDSDDQRDEQMEDGEDEGDDSDGSEEREAQAPTPEELEAEDRDALHRYLESLSGPSTNLPLERAREESRQQVRQPPARPW